MRMRFQNSRVFAAVLGLFLLVALPSTLQAQQAEAAPEDVKIDMRNSKFDEDVVMIATNQTVIWTNRDSFAHDVTGIGNNLSSPPDMAKDATYQYKFENAGVFDYYCSIHPGKPAKAGDTAGMWGRVIVVEGPILPLAGGGEGGISPEEAGVNWLAHWVGVISFVAVFATLIIYYFVLKFGETMHATDHRDRKEP